MPPGPTTNSRTHKTENPPPRTPAKGKAPPSTPPSPAPNARRPVRASSIPRPKDSAPAPAPKISAAQQGKRQKFPTQHVPEAELPAGTAQIPNPCAAHHSKPAIRRDEIRIVHW